MRSASPMKIAKLQGLAGQAVIGMAAACATAAHAATRDPSCDDHQAFMNLVLNSNGPLNAVILSFVGAVAWFFKLFYDSISRYIRELRNSIDMIIALDHEIKENNETERLFCELDANSGELWATGFKRKIEQYERAGRSFKGFTAVTSGDRIFKHISSRIFDLPSECIDAIVDYYNISEGLLAGIQLLQTEDFERLATDRKFDAVDHVVKVAAEAVSYGAKAREAIRLSKVNETTKMTAAEAVRLAMIVLALILLIGTPTNLMLHFEEFTGWATRVSCSSP
jgi:hypothetical protein